MKDLYLSLYEFCDTHSQTTNKKSWTCCIRSVLSSRTLTPHCNEVLEVHSSAIIRTPVKSHNQGLLINHLSLNSNYQTVFLEWDGYGAKLPTKDIV